MMLCEGCGDMLGETHSSPRLLQDDYLYADSPMLVDLRSENVLGTVMAIATSSFPYLSTTYLGSYIKV